MKALPRARQASLIIKEVDGETLVYDLETDQAHCLNHTASQIWKSCDGQTSVDEIAVNLRANADARVDENVVWLALDQLEKFKLLENPVAKPAYLSGLSRRQVVRAIGVAAIVAPLITSMVVPTAAQGGPQLNLGECCNNPNQCISNCCQQLPTPCLCAPGSTDPNCASPGSFSSGKQCAPTPSPNGPICQ
jgi:Coenzyme PQQ synthesis protein D (PqqD)